MKRLIAPLIVVALTGCQSAALRDGVSPNLGSIDKTLDEAQRARLLAWNGEGALVVATVPGSPAERAGLLPGDVIVQYAGVWIDGMGLPVNLASRSVIDREQEVWVLRDGAMERLYVTPIDRHEMERP